MRWIQRPFLSSYKRRKSGDGIEDGSDKRNMGDKTQDGTKDYHGRPASRSKTGGWRGCMFILVEQLTANVAFYGISSNLFIYLTTVMHETTSSAAKNVNNYYGAGFVTPLIGAFIADSYTGRFMATLIMSMLELVAIVMITIVGSVHGFCPPQCPNSDFTCKHATVGQGVLLYTGLYFMNLGSGGIIGIQVAFGADQFDEEDNKEKEQKSAYFNVSYQTVLMGSFIASTLFVYVQEHVSFGLTWGISGVVLFLGIVFFVMGVRLYRYHSPGGNPLARFAQVVVASIRNRRVKVFNIDDLYEVDDTNSVIKGSRMIQHSNKFQFLDKAAIVTTKDKERGLVQNPWHVCTVTQVEEVKFLLRVLPVFLTSIVYTICYSQLTTFFIEQAYTLERKLGSFLIPAASLAIFECLSVFFWGFFYQKILVPFLHKLTGNPRGMGMLKRMGIGLGLSICSMGIAALVENRRLKIAQDHGLLDDTETPIPMSIFWVVPQYFVMGASEIFTYVGMMEFFYEQAPDAVRSIGEALSTLSLAFGYFISTLLITIVGNITTTKGRPGWIADNINHGRLDLFYLLLVVLSMVNLVAFVLCAWRYEYMVTQPILCTWPIEVVEASGGPLSQKGNDHRQLQLDVPK